MPTMTRRSATDSNTGTADRRTETDEAAATAKAATHEAASDTAVAGSGAAGSLRAIITAPVAVARAVADDVVTTVRRPHVVLYVGGLVGLAALGVLEWPVAAVAEVGLAVANGVRRTRV